MKKISLLLLIAASVGVLGQLPFPSGGGGGGGGTTNLTGILDFKTVATATTLQNTSCAVATPCNASVNGSPVSPFTGQPYNATMVNASCTAGSCSGDIYEYIDTNGTWTLLYGNNNFLNGGLTAAGWTATFQGAITGFPIGVCPLYHWVVAAGAINTTPTVDQHGLACRAANYTGGTNVTVSSTGVISATGAASAGGNGVFQQSNGSGGFSAAPCTNAFGVVTCTQSVQNNNGYAIEVGQGFGVTTCATTATLQPGGWNVINVTGNCTLSIAAPGVDGIGMELLICEDGVGGHTITFPASFIGTGTPVTTANKCNSQLFRGSNLGGSIGGHTINATWFATATMVSY